MGILIKVYREGFGSWLYCEGYIDVYGRACSLLVILSCGSLEKVICWLRSESLVGKVS